MEDRSSVSESFLYRGWNGLDSTPEGTFCWVLRSNGEIHLGAFGGERFEDPYYFGDHREGLLKEYWEDVIAWKDLEYPKAE